jgi:hypothetical protein
MVTLGTQEDLPPRAVVLLLPVPSEMVRFNVYLSTSVLAPWEMSLRVGRDAVIGILDVIIVCTKNT